MYDHTDADVPMMREAAIGLLGLIQPDPPCNCYSCRTGVPIRDPVTGSIGYDDEGQPFARTYPPQGMRCS